MARVAVAFTARDDLDGRDQTGRQTALDEHAAHEVRRGRLAVRAGDTDDAQCLARVAVEPCGDDSERGARRGNQNLRNAHTGYRALSDERDRATLDGGRSVVVAICGLAGHGHEDVTRGDLARV